MRDGPATMVRPVTPDDLNANDLVSLVNPLCGSDSEPSYSTGLTYPAVGVPWGTTYFSPRNRPLGHVFSRRPTWPTNAIGGFTATHAPSPWMGEYGSFTVMPYPAAAADVPADLKAIAAVYRLDAETSRPDLFDVTARGQRHPVRADGDEGVWPLTHDNAAGADAAFVDRAATRLRPLRGAAVDGERSLVGVARDGRELIDGYGCHYRLTLDRPIVSDTSSERTATRNCSIVDVDASDNRNRSS